jgi:HK97 family phage portal protein
VVLEDGIEPVALQLTGVDLQFIEQRKLQPEDVCRFFNMPPHKVGIASDAKGASTNLAAQDQDYVNSSLSSRTVSFEQRWDFAFELDKDEKGRRLPKDEQLHLKRDLKQLLRADGMTRANASRIRILSGVTTQNEERRGEGLAPMPGGDRLMMPTNMAAEGSDKSGMAPDGAGRPKDGTVGENGTGQGGTQTTDQLAADEPAQN